MEIFEKVLELLIMALGIAIWLVAFSRMGILPIVVFRVADEEEEEENLPY